jgi:hypothetical protein
MADPRFAAYPEDRPALIAISPQLSEYARCLGRAADRLAQEDPLPSPARISEQLGLVPIPEGVAALPSGRALKVAAASSRGAALSARLELYPRGMAAAKALSLALGALTGAKKLTEDELRARVRGRFPEAEPLPPRPELDALLDQVGADREWRTPPDGEPAYYTRTVADSETGTITPFRRPTHAPPAETTPEVLDARALEEKIAHAARTGAFLALTVEPKRAPEAETELLRRFPRELVSLERLMLRAMRAEAEARRLAAAPDFRMNLAVGDSLFHGTHFFRGDLGGATEGFGRKLQHHYVAEDTASLDKILGRQYHAVVGNPPYITPKDPAMRDAYREIYSRSCHGTYGLGVPFIERFFDLAQAGGQMHPAGFVGLIVANSFMKREFGKKLIEGVLPRLDLTHMVDCSGAYIPGHGTPTIIMFGRNRPPVAKVVRTVRGIRGEPSAPDDPAGGLVWSAIVAQPIWHRAAATS